MVTTIHGLSSVEDGNDSRSLIPNPSKGLKGGGIVFSSPAVKEVEDLYLWYIRQGVTYL